MNSNEAVVKILEIKVKYDDAIKKMAEYQKNISDAKEHEKELKQQLRDGTITRQEYNEQVAASQQYIRLQQNANLQLTRQVMNQIKAQKEQIGSLNQLRAQLSALTQSYDALGKAEREGAAGQQLKNKINALTTEIKEAEYATQRFYRNVGNYKDAAASLEILGQKAAGLKNLLLSAFGGLSTSKITSDILQAGSAFEDQMAKVRAVTNATEKDFRSMRDEALRLGGSTRYTATEAGEAMEYLTRNGLSANDATQTLEQTLHLAQANVIGLGEAADITTNMLNSFHLGVENAGRVADVMSKTSANSATTISLLNEAMRNSAPLAFTLGISFEEMNATLGVLADNNIKGANAGTMLRQVLMGLTSPTQAQAAVFKQYGLDIDQNTIRTEGLIATLHKLADSGIMQSKNSVKELGDVFGRLAAPSALTLLNSLEGLDEKILVVGNSAGTTDRMFQQSFGDFTIAADSMRSAWESFLITVYDNNKGSLVGPIDLLTKGISYARDHFDELVTLVKSAVAGFTLAKVVAHIQESAGVASSSVTAAAEATSAKVNAIAQQEVEQRKIIEQLKIQEENAASSEKLLIQQKLLVQRAQLAETEKALHKAKAAEIRAYETVEAYATGTAWEKGMLTAKVAVLGFFTAAKAAAKTFFITAAITIAIEAIYKLVEAFSSGESALDRFQKAHEETAKKIEEQNAEIQKSVADSTADEILKLQHLQNVLDDSNRSYDDRKKALDDLQKMVPDYHASLSKEGKLFDDNRTAIDNYVAGLKKAALAEAAYNKMKQNMSTILDAQFTIDELDNRISDTKGNLRKQGLSETDQVKTTTTYAGTASFGMAMSYSSQSVTDAQGNEKLGSVKALEEGKKAIESFTEQKKVQNDIIEQYTRQNERLQKVIEETGVNPIRKAASGNNGNSGSGSGDGISGGNGSSSKSGNEAQEEEKRQKILRDGQAALTKMIADNLARQRQQLLDGYANQISDLQQKLEKEKNLTADAKRAINDQILALEKERDQKMEALYAERYNRMAEEQSRTLSMRLSLAKKGSEEQYELTLQSIAEEYEKRRAVLDEKIAEESQHVKAIEEEYSLAENSGASESELAAIQQRLDVESAMLEDYNEQKRLTSEEQREAEAEAEDEYQQSIIERTQQTYENQINELMLKRDRTEEEQRNILDLQLQANEDYLSALMERGIREGETQEEFDAEIIAAKERKAESEKAISDYEIEIEKAKYDAASQITGGLIKLTSAIGQNNKEMAMLSKIVTLAQIAIDTGKAISSGVANASAVPYPANLVAIATTVATVLANIATAISTVNSAKFAHGGSPREYTGKVSGPGGKNDKDLITVRVNKDELILNEDQQKRLHMDLTGKGGEWTPDAQRELFGIAEGRIEPVPFAPITSSFNEIGASVPVTSWQRSDVLADNDTLTEGIVEGIEGMPAPVVSVEDINDGQRRIEVIENIDTL